MESTVSSVAEEYAASSAEDSAAPEHSEVEPEDSEPDVMSVLESQWEEPSVADLYAEVANQFRQLTYTDEETGLTIPYNLYVPEGSTDEAYPMVVFISDSTSVGQDLSAPLTQGYGGIIWASEHEQAKHKGFVLVPEYPEIIIDDDNGTQITDYVDATASWSAVPPGSCFGQSIMKNDDGIIPCAAADVIFKDATLRKKQQR